MYGKCPALDLSQVGCNLLKGVLDGVVVRVGIDIQGDAGAGVSHEVLQTLDVDACPLQIRTEGMPIPYNKDKTRNPSKIKGFRACPYSFSNKNILRSRLKGGVEK